MAARKKAAAKKTGKKSTKRVSASQLRESMKRLGEKLPHGYEIAIRKKK